MEALLGSMLLLGLASGLHCVGMCGGIAFAFGKSNPFAFNQRCTVGIVVIDASIHFDLARDPDAARAVSGVK